MFSISYTNIAKHILPFFQSDNLTRLPRAKAAVSSLGYSNLLKTQEGFYMNTQTRV
jgi:hypothetical protein